MLLFIRHGETDFNHKGLWMGCTDIALNAHGKQQALEVAKSLSSRTINLIFTSPLQRAYMTAQAISNEQKGKPSVVIVDDLRERGFGVLEGTPRTQPLDDYFDCIEGVEKKETLIKRLDSALSDIQKKALDKTVLIVSHGAVFHCLSHDMGYLCNPPVISHLGNCQAVVISK